MTTKVTHYTPTEGGTWYPITSVSIFIKDLSAKIDAAALNEIMGRNSDAPLIAIKLADGSIYDFTLAQWGYLGKKYQSEGLEATLAERGSRYGPFEGHAAITQELKTVMRATSNWNTKLSHSQREALEMIAHKIGRILNGDPNYPDSWHDIAGYATRVEQEL